QDRRKKEAREEEEEKEKAEKREPGTQKDQGKTGTAPPSEKRGEQDRPPPYNENCIPRPQPVAGIYPMLTDQLQEKMVEMEIISGRVTGIITEVSGPGLREQEYGRDRTKQEKVKEPIGGEQPERAGAVDARSMELDLERSTTPRSVKLKEQVEEYWEEQRRAGQKVGYWIQEKKEPGVREVKPKYHSTPAVRALGRTGRAEAGPSGLGERQRRPETPKPDEGHWIFSENEGEDWEQGSEKSERWGLPTIDQKREGYGERWSNMSKKKTGTKTPESEDQSDKNRDRHTVRSMECESPEVGEDIIMADIEGKVRITGVSGTLLNVQASMLEDGLTEIKKAKEAAAAVVNEVNQSMRKHQELVESMGQLRT
ncbi:MAG: hypothetical protein ACRC6N_00020, partial [Plesiomonas sp.]|uniref:hypothetical protein n=1 Tax=Plesiomonas sp. TaxID=2486279 RepID=UPI003F329A77